MKAALEGTQYIPELYDIIMDGVNGVSFNILLINPEGSIHHQELERSIEYCNLKLPFVLP